MISEMKRFQSTFDFNLFLELVSKLKTFFKSDPLPGARASWSKWNQETTSSIALSTAWDFPPSNEPLSNAPDALCELEVGAGLPTSPDGAQSASLCRPVGPLAGEYKSQTIEPKENSWRKQFWKELSRWETSYSIFRYPKAWKKIKTHMFSTLKLNCRSL